MRGTKEKKTQSVSDRSRKMNIEQFNFERNMSLGLNKLDNYSIRLQNSFNLPVCTTSKSLYKVYTGVVSPFSCISSFVSSFVFVVCSRVLQSVVCRIFRFVSWVRIFSEFEQMSYNHNHNNNKNTVPFYVALFEIFLCSTQLY